MGLKSTLFVLLSVFFMTSITGQSCGDFFYDSGGENGEYTDGESQQWVFCPENEGDLVTLDFTIVGLETCCDNLAVYSGSPDGAGSGTSFALNLDIEEPGSYTSLSSDGCLTITWTSDGSITGQGWVAGILCEPEPECGTPSFLDAIPTSIGGMLSWQQVGTADVWDLEIGLAGFLPTGEPTIADVTTNPYIWEEGTSGIDYDYYVRASCGSDWAGPFSFTTVPGCGDHFYDSGGADGPYQDNESSIWVFCPDVEGEQVTLSFVTIDIDPFGADPLVIYDGNSVDGDVLSPLVANPDIFTSSTEDGCLTVTFMSNGFTFFNGWEAIVSCNLPPLCPNPSSLGVENTTTAGADIIWTENGEASAWDIEIVLAGIGSTGTPTITGVVNNPYQWAGGESGTEYDYYIRAQCGTDDETSNWVGPFRFTTHPSCGDNFYDLGGVDGNYGSSENETWVFCPDEPGDVVVLDFTVVNINIFADALGVYNGDTTLQAINAFVQTPGTYISTAANGCLTVSWVSGFFSGGEGWEATITCTPCPPVQAAFLSITDVNAFDVAISWETAIVDVDYSIEYGLAGFTQGDGDITTGVGNSGVISGLEEDTSYDFYVSFFCADGELSSLLGPFSFTTLFNNDLAISNLLSPSTDCGLGFDEVIQIAITNYGVSPQTLFPINFSVNGVLAGVNQPIDGFYTGIVSNDSTEIFEFDLHYNFDLPGEYTIQLWTDLENDTNRSNDTFSIVLTKFGTPFFEDFESGVIPPQITTNGDEFVTADHNNTSFVLADNLFFFGDTMKAELPVLGPIGENDTLFFDYRYTIWPAGDAPAQMTIADTLMVRVSEDCGETYETVFLSTGNNHEPSTDFSTAVVPLGGYEGSNLKIQILGIYGSGDNWLDFDNINIPTCDNITLNATITNASAHDANDGVVDLSVLGGITPYTYQWNDGSNSGSRTDLAPDNYTVVVTDRFGCTTALFIEVSAPVGTDNLPQIINALQLMPNPTAGFTQIRASFSETLDAQVEVVNLLGQTIWKSTPQTNVNSLDLAVDLSNVPAAMYLVRIYAADQIVSMKLLKTE